MTGLETVRAATCAKTRFGVIAAIEWEYASPQDAGRMADSQAQSNVRASPAARGVSAANPTARWYELRRDRKPRGRQPNTPVRVTCLADWAPQADMPF